MVHNEHGVVVMLKILKMSNALVLCIELTDAMTVKYRKEVTFRLKVKKTLEEPADTILFLEARNHRIIIKNSMPVTTMAEYVLCIFRFAYAQDALANSTCW